MAGRPPNNFDSLRFTAAFGVLVSHAFPLTYGTNDNHELLWIISRSQATIGTLCVWVFFVISGYLIAQSFDRNPDPLRFVRARCLRIFPGLVVSLTVTAVFLCTVTTLPLLDYLASKDTWLFVLRGAVLYSGTDPVLPGVFGGLPYHDAVNGSLWTLQYEFTMYGAVLTLGVLDLLSLPVALFATAITLLMSWRYIGGYWGEFGACFAAGSALYLGRDRIKPDAYAALVCVVLIIAAVFVGGLRLVFATAGAYLIIYLATAPTIKFPNFARYGDLSYGIYIFAFPVEQTTVYLLGHDAAWYSVAAISTPITLGLAWLSWHLIENPALRLKMAKRPISDRLRLDIPE